MNLYTVLMVDDEEDIRLGIINKMDWEAYGFTVVGQAENGLEALEIAENLRPDIVLTDIKMPYMDGLELCDALTKRLPATKIVVFSGFDDFSYAKQAIHMSVSEYILKPINSAELAEVLIKIKNQLDKERQERQDIQLLKQQYIENLPILRELFLTRFIEGKLNSEQIVKGAEDFNLNIKESVFMVGIAHVSDNSKENELILLSAQKLIEEHFRLDNCICTSFLYNDNLALLFNFTEKVNPYLLLDAVNRICELSSSYLNVSLSVGIGLPCEDYNKIGQSTSGARSALDYHVLVKTGKALYIGDLEPNNIELLSFEQNDEQELTTAIKLGTEFDIKNNVSKLLEKMQSSSSAIAQSQLYFLEIFTCLLKLTRSNNLNLEDVFGENLTEIPQISSFNSHQELENWFIKSCLSLNSLLGKRRTDSAWRTIEKAKEFIILNYAQSDLSVETLCEYLHLSSAYFSTLFKRETNMSFTAYVTVIRMEEAARLLLGTDDKTYLIAEKTGYIDQNYFSYVFKKYYGVSPTKYRATKQ